MQHHDGITGTESPEVADMYLQHLTQAMMDVEELLAALFLLPHDPGVTDGETGPERVHGGGGAGEDTARFLEKDFSGQN